MNNIINIVTGEVNISKKERIISTAGGVALLVAGILSLKKKPAMSWAEIATGALLLYRGTTGHCPLNAALDRNTAVEELAEEAEDAFEDLA